jgi:hypothetical protein
MAETGGREGTGPYNYARFDGYVAAGGDIADEAAFWPHPARVNGHRISRCHRWATAPR